MSSLPVLAFAAAWVRNWLTPIWIVCVGVVFGFIILGLIWAVCYLISRGSSGRLREFADDIPVGIREGVLWPITLIGAGMACFAVALLPIAHSPMQVVSAVGDLASGGTTAHGPFEIEAGEGKNHSEIAISLYRNQVQRIQYHSTEDVMISAKPITEVLRQGSVVVYQNDTYTWSSNTGSVPFQTPSDDLPNHLTKLYIQNMGDNTATILIRTETISKHPESIAIPITALGLVLCYLFYFVQRAAFPKVSAIALSTSKSETGSHLFLLVTAIASLALVIFLYLPYYTFGEDIKVLKNASFDLITVMCSLVAVWAASNSITEEIEGRTALTVLSKPVSRRSFVLGKFFGIVWSIGLMFMVLGLVMLVVVSFKPIFDSRENSEAGPTWQLCHMEMISAVPGLLLAFMQTVILAAISVAISTQLPMLPNLVICFAVYVMGQLTPLLVQSSFGEFEPVAFVGQLIATIFPNLNHFDIQAAIAGGVPVPFVYLAGALVYCMLYSLIAMLLALIMFEDRDLA